MTGISRRRFLEQSAAATAGAAVLTSQATNAASASKENAPLRLCRYRKGQGAAIALYQDDFLIDLGQLASAVKAPVPASTDLLDFLPPAGKEAAGLNGLVDRFRGLPAEEQARLRTPTSSAKLLVPVPEPNKVILLAGNYASHIIEAGRQAPERVQTFPYFFWKPPSTTLTNPGDPIRIPKVSPDHVDWEIELGVIIGKRCRDVTEGDALNYVAGYSVCNDVSDRKFTINPGRKKREMDNYFDWLHGKWHDTFLPMGPCVRSAADVSDPQKFGMKLRVNGQVMQDANTGQMIFPVAALVAILSTFMVLEPGDIISTGTPAGVGHSRKPPIYLKKGDVVEADIDGIGLLRNPVV